MRKQKKKKQATNCKRKGCYHQKKKGINLLENTTKESKAHFTAHWSSLARYARVGDTDLKKKKTLDRRKIALHHLIVPFLTNPFPFHV